MTDRELMQQALDALEYMQGIVDTERGPRVAAALRSRLAQPEQEPSWQHPARKLAKWLHCMSYNDSYFGEPAGLVKHVTGELNRLLYAAPQPEQEPVAFDQIEEQALKVHDHLAKALRIPTMPWPDPYAHGHEAAARAIHASYCAIRFAVMDAIGSLTALRAAFAACAPQPQRKPLTQEKSRAAFEAFVRSEMGDIAVMDAGRYISPKINNYWRVWQAAHGIGGGA